MKNGFTLVELSIVLVIIGLLIGGILVGQSMIQSAQTLKIVRKLQQYDAAVNSFHSKFKGLPGDSNKFGGNDDNMIVGSSSHFLDGELANFWPNLEMSGFKVDKTETAIVETMGNGVAVFVYYDGTENSYNFNNSSEEPLLGDEFAVYPSVTPLKMLAIDTKIDDSKPLTGRIRNFSYGDFGTPIGSEGCDNDDGYSNLLTTVYTPEIDKKSCYFNMKL